MSNNINDINDKINIPPVYVVNFKNEERKKRMLKRFTTLDIIPNFINEVELTDPRVSKCSFNNDIKRTWCVMLQHLDCIRDFYNNTNEKYCIVCEDDIHISKNFCKDLPNIICNFNNLNLDVLMLGYLLSYKIQNESKNHKHYFPIIKNKDIIVRHDYHKYPDDIWGTQMYLITRKYANFLLDKFTPEFAFNNIDNINYNPDWIITKNGNRALIVPMVAVEEGINISDCYNQNIFHKKCYDLNYDEKLYI
tara:strand:- start:272 stop:1021 length:750 start_codon:yes stop_codon:yes gene_type:complete